MASSSLQSPIAKKLESKVTLIIGGASGVGAMTVRFFVQHGAKVTITDIQDNLRTFLVQEIGTEHTIFVHCNVVIESDVQYAVDATVVKFGKLDIMFSNAGTIGKSISSILEVDYDIIKNVLDVNVVGAFFCAKHAARVMIPTKIKGSIIFTARSTTVVYGIAPHAYVALKCAVLGLSKNIEVELGKYRIKVNCVSPHYISTPLAMNALGIVDREIGDKWFAGGNLKGILLDEEEVAKAVLYFASDDSNYVSGTNLDLDGGYSTTNLTLTEAYNKLFPSVCGG